MAKTTSCPELHDLEKLVAGKLAPQELDILTQHLEGCACCLDRIQTLSPSDTLIDQLGRPETLADAPDDPAVTRLIERLKTLGGAKAASEFVRLSCAGCGKKLKVRADLRGKKIKCPGCGEAIAVPETGAAATAVPEAATLPPRPADPKPAEAATLAPRADPEKETLAPANPAAVDEAQAETSGELGQSDKEAWDFLAPAQQADEIGRLGSYRVLKVLGRGGMGVVFRGEDPQLKRPVALKAMLPAYAASGSAKQRFLREAQSAAALKHDHIVSIYQVGEDRGVPFLAMEFLEGEPLDARIKREKPLPVPEAVRIGREIAEGLAAAHDQGLIHRDIKPGNVWLETASRKQTSTAPGGGTSSRRLRDARVKILDFGLARSLADQTQLTQSGAIIGTPAYMAPEQAGGRAVDHRCDLFSLGSVLYQLCTGELPFKGNDTIAIITALALETPRPPSEINPQVPAELSDFIMRLLAKKPEERPDSAHEVIDALQAIEDGLKQSPDQPASAGKKKAPTTAAPAKATAATGAPRLPARRRLIVGAAAAGALALILGGLVFFLQTKNGTVRIDINGPGIVAHLDQDRAVIDGVGVRDVKIEPGEHGLRIKHGDLDFETDKFVLRKGETVTLKVELLPGKVQVVHDGKVIGEKALPASAITMGPPPAGPLPENPFDALRREDIPEYELAQAGNGSRAKAPAELVAIFGDSRMRHAYGGDAGVSAVAFSPDSRSIASVCGGDTRLWDATSGRQVRSFPGAYSVAFSPDGRRLAAPYAVNGLVFGVHVHDLDTGEELLKLDHEVAVNGVVYNPTGTRLATIDSKGVVSVWDAAKGVKLFAVTHGGGVSSVAFRPDGSQLATAGSDKIIKIWDAQTGKAVAELKGHTAGVLSIAFHPDGSRLASCAPGDPAIRLWDTGTWTTKKSLKGSYDFWQVAFSPDGSRLAGLNAPGSVLAWDPKTGEELASLTRKAVGPTTLTEKSGFGVSSFAFSPDGKRLVTGGGHWRVRVWDTATGEQLPVGAGESGLAYSLAVSPDSRQIAVATDDGVVVWDVATRQVARKLTDAGGGIKAVRWSPDGKYLAAAGYHSGACLWDTETGAKRFLWGIEGCTDVAFSPDGKLLAVTGLSRTQLLEVPSGREVKSYEFGGASVAFNPDGRRLAVFGHFQKPAVVLDRVTGATLCTVKNGNYYPIWFSADGREIIGRNPYAPSKFWDAATGVERPVATPFNMMAVSPDGRRAFGYAGNELRLIDPHSGEGFGPAFPLPYGLGLRAAALTADGRYAVIASATGPLWVYPLPPPEKAATAPAPPPGATGK